MPADTVIPPMLVSERQAAAALGVSVRTMFSLRAHGQIPFVPIRSRVLYSPADLARWIESRRIIAAPPSAPLGHQNSDGDGGNGESANLGMNPQTKNPAGQGRGEGKNQ